MAINDMVESDTGTRLRLRITKPDGSVYDLTGVTAKLIWKNGDTVVERALDIENPATSGYVSYQFAAGELIGGVMRFEVKLTDGAGKILRNLDPIRFTVRYKVGT